MRIGKLGEKRNERVNFKTWAKNFYKKGTIKKLKITRIFLPFRYDNFTLIMQDQENNVEVSRTLQKEIAKQLLKHYGFSTKSIARVILFLQIDENGNLDVISEESSNYGYIFEKNSFVLRNVNEIQVVEDDIPF